MKMLTIDSPTITEIDMLKENSIQGLYSSKDAIQSFWSLKAKIELAVFKEHKKEAKKA
jgi:hypothetical protein